MSEDTLFMIDLMSRVKRIGISSGVWYNYYINDYSISRRKVNEKVINEQNSNQVENKQDSKNDNNISENSCQQSNALFNILSNDFRHSSFKIHIFYKNFL